MNNVENINSLEKTFNNNISDTVLKAHFISNNYKEGRKVLTAIEDELLRCDEFLISVAFITLGGIEPLLQTLKNLEEKGIKGRILTTDYLCFSEPRALTKLHSLKNIELRMFLSNEAKEGFHTKGYIFKKDKLYNIIVGSSNITQSALTKNKEWNTRIISNDHSEYSKQIISEFWELWDSGNTKEYEEFIDEYRFSYELIKRQKKAVESVQTSLNAKYELEPNKMQKEFTKSLIGLIDNGEKKALLISATGTGKTYASAFAMRAVKAERVLFLAHRNQILKQAKKSYRNVFGGSKKLEILSGNDKDYEKIAEADFVFGMMTMLAKSEVRERFSKNEFDIIVIDEVHRAGAVSYKKIMEYFKPRLWLGMTASPDRPDECNIYELFDNNIAYEIRLEQALEEELLCTFHYFGITDLEVDGKAFDDNTNKLRLFNLLASDKRVDYIIEKLDYFGYSGDRVKGLIFCSSVEEAELLSEKFNRRGYKTCALSGKDSIEFRDRAIERLTEDKNSDYLDYIFSVDILNEGVDIPEVNQIVMLRPTESPIVFIQQLGRGLRKCEGKEFVVILDFIGNYTNNYLIPIALSGDRSKSKDTLRRYIAEGTRIMPGSSSIHFDEITKERIYRSIDTAKINTVSDIVYEYRCLRNKIGRIPSYEDFENYNTIDMTCIFDNKSLGSYHNFLKKYESGYKYKAALTDSQEEMLMFISQKIADGKRIDELLVLKRLLKSRQNITQSCQSCQSYQSYMSELKHDYGIEGSERRMSNVISVLSNNFVPVEKQKEKFSRSVFVEGGKIEPKASPQLLKQCNNKVFLKLFNELIDYGIYRYNKYYKNRYKDTDFVLYKKYTKSDICRLLNWSKNINPQAISGYFYDKDTKTLPIFITYKKDENVSESLRYEHGFISPLEFISVSKGKRNYNSPEMDYFYDKETSIYLFMQKSCNDKGAGDYYFLGQLYNTGEKELSYREKIGDTVLKFHYTLDVPLREDLYQYFTCESFPDSNKN